MNSVDYVQVRRGGPSSRVKHSGNQVNLGMSCKNREFVGLIYEGACAWHFLRWRKCLQLGRSV